MSKPDESLVFASLAGARVRHVLDPEVIGVVERAYRTRRPLLRRVGRGRPVADVVWPDCPFGLPERESLNLLEVMER